MRLLIALLFATALAALTTLVTTSGQKSKLMTNGYVLQTKEQDKNYPDHDSRNGNNNNSSSEDRLDRWGWLWQAINKVFIFVLAGWAVGRLSMQFRKLIFIFLGLVIVFDFLLVQAGLVQFTVRWENIESIFQIIKQAIIGIGVVEFLSILAGLWAGLMGFRSAERRQRAESAE
jgi:hypothetical protein